MLATNTLWLEVALVSMVFALGNILMGHFEERTPKWRRVGKYVLTLVLICATSWLLGRAYALGLLGFGLLVAVYVHAWVLPRKHGIHGWTGEPRERYYALRGWDPMPPSAPHANKRKATKT